MDVRKTRTTLTLQRHCATFSQVHCSGFGSCPEPLSLRVKGVVSFEKLPSAYVQHVQHHTVLFVEVGPTSTFGQGSKGSSTGGVSVAHCLAFPSKPTTSWVTDMGLLVWDALDTAT